MQQLPIGFSGVDPSWRRALWIALAVNGAMFVAAIMAVLDIAGGVRIIRQARRELAGPGRTGFLQRGAA